MNENNFDVTAANTGEQENTETINEVETNEATEATETSEDTCNIKTEDEKENQKETNKLSEEYNILYDKYLRINAEYDNFRKRTAKEKEGIYSDSVIDVLKNILPVLDNVERALQFADSSEPEKVSEGVKMIHAQFMSSLAKIGVEEIKACGEQFNPEVHNAVFHEEVEGQPNNTVTEVLQKGYVRGDKVIRPAMVKVVN